MTTRTLLHRRQFLGAAAASFAAPYLLDPALHAKDREGQGPNGRINLGFIGIGMMGRGHLGSFLGNRGVQVVAVCDVHRQRREDAVERVHRAYAAERKSGAYRGCTAFIDFRELLARRDIDAVVIGTPDHWHAIPAILAARARKDIYCEKPLSLTIAEGRAMVQAARDNNVVFQTGSQQRTEFNGYFRKAVEYVRSGRLGQIRTVRIGVGAPPRPCDLPNEMTPDGTDWEMWNGPSPARAFHHVLCPLNIHTHFPAWRNYREYAGGQLADMGAHHFDIAQWALNMDHSAPTEIHPPERGDTGLRFVYANGIEMFHGGPTDCVFEGANGTIRVRRGGIDSTPAEILQTPLTDREFHLPNVGNSHRQNWLNCVRNRTRPVADVAIGARSAQVCQLANIGYQLRQVRLEPGAPGVREQRGGQPAAQPREPRAMEPRVSMPTDSLPPAEAPPFRRPAHRLFAPEVVGIATILTGPVGGLFLLALNFWQLGRRRAAGIALVCAVPVLPALVALGAFLFESPGFLLIFLVLAGGVLWGAAEISQRNAYTEHRRQGGRVGTIASTAGLALLGLALSLGAYYFAYDALLKPPGSKITLASGDEVFYRSPATLIDARALGTFLTEAGYFTGQPPKRVMIARDGARLVLWFAVEPWVLKDAEAQHKCRDLGRQAALRAFGSQSVDVLLCDRQFHVEKRL